MDALEFSGYFNHNLVVEEVDNEVTKYYLIPYNKL